MACDVCHEPVVAKILQINNDCILFLQVVATCVCHSDTVYKECGPLGVVPGWLDAVADSLHFSTVRFTQLIQFTV